MFGEDNVGYAIPIDRVRSSFHDLAAPEERGDFWTGLTLDPLATEARVVGLAAGGPADRCGFRIGDRVAAIDGKPLGNGIEWLLALTGRRPGDSLTVTLERAAGRHEVSLKLDQYPRTEAIPPDGKAPGLRYEVEHGELNTLADRHRLRPVRQGMTDGLDLTRLDGVRTENYAVTFTGYLEIPETGVYHLILGSDDGSRLALDGQMVVDNDGNHPYQEVRGVRRLAQGLHRMKLEYFQGRYGASLSLRLERDQLSPGAPPVSLRFCRD